VNWPRWIANPTTQWQVWLAAFCTIGIYSFLFKENRVYRALQHIFFGLGVGIFFTMTWTTVLKPNWWDPMIAGFVHGDLRALRVLWGLVGLLWYFQYSRKRMWLSRIPMGLAMGAGAGVAFKDQFLRNMPQITKSFKPLLVNRAQESIAAGGGPIDWGRSLNNIFFIITLVSVMTYFFFSFEHKLRPVKGTVKVGRTLLMISLGAFFGNTVMTRMAVFLERLQFLLGDWLHFAH
jgi:hypothetical protein